MKSVLIMSFTSKGLLLSNLINKSLDNEYKTDEYVFYKYANDTAATSFTNGKDLMKKAFEEKYDYVIFVGATAMAVRMLDGLMKGKDEDPGVIVLDVMAKFAISLLSGHIGGANEFCELIAKITGAIPVITTATDVTNHFAPDVFAKKNNLNILSLDKAKEVAAAIVDGRKIKLYSEIKLSDLPDELILVDNESEIDDKELSIRILREEREHKANALYLIKKDIILGVGCRKNIEASIFEEEIINRLNKNHIDIKRVQKLHSINLKKDEPAIKEFCEKYRIESEFFTEDELNRVSGEFTKSEFVQNITGVDNVCERSAAIYGDEIIIRKIAKNGVTLSVARRK